MGRRAIIPALSREAAAADQADDDDDDDFHRAVGRKVRKVHEACSLSDAAAPTMLALWATEPLDKLNHHIEYADHSPNSLADFTAVNGPVQQVQERFFDMVTNDKNCDGLLLTNGC